VRTIQQKRPKALTLRSRKFGSALKKSSRRAVARQAMNCLTGCAQNNSSERNALEPTQTQIGNLRRSKLVKI